MPDYTQYPQGSDVQTFLTNTGLRLPFSTDDYCAAAQASVDEFENKTGYRPFLANAGLERRLFDPPRMGPQAGRINSDQGGRVLDLNGGVIQVPDDGVLIGFVPNTTDEIGIAQGITDDLGSAGTVLTRGLQYYLKPNDAFHRGIPWTHIEFLTPTRGVPQSIVVNAIWGYTQTLTADVWRAILTNAAASLISQTSLFNFSGMDSFTQAGVTEKYASGPKSNSLASAADDWQKSFRRQCFLYKRIVV